MKHFRKIALVLSTVLITQNIFGQGWSVNPAVYSTNGSITAIVVHGPTEVTSGTIGAFVGSECRGVSDGGVFFLPTLKTIFTMMVYYDVPGDILTFKFFDLSDGSIYDITETISTTTIMIIGDAFNPQVFHTIPLTYNVTGGGSYCQGGSGLPVGLDNSEPGVNYTLIRNGIDQTTVGGTGSALDFGNKLAGTYTVRGTNSGGTVNMTGSAVITEVVTNPPTGSASQSFCTDAIVSNLTATGSNIQWYDVSSGGSPLGGSTTLINGNHYYASQTVSGCESQTRLNVTVTVSPVPATPAAISGTATQCAGLTGQTYTIVAVPNATTYTWTVPTGWTVTAGAGSISITVTVGSVGQNGDISVTAGNSCGTSSPRTLAVTVNSATPVTPGTISGTIAQCSGLTGQIYSISPVADATTYNWLVPTGWSITGGAGTTSITVTTGSAGQNGNITVSAGNSCGTSALKSLSVTVTSAPATPGAISGTAVQCPGLTGRTYSISAVPNASTYTWTVPGGWSITGGTGTTSITVTTGSAGQNGNITVTAGNGCGTSSESTLPVSVSPAAPATPGSITGISGQCAGLTGQTYSISSVTNATTYTWTLPGGWSVTGGAGTTSITVTTGSAGQNGNINVTAGNSCGTSTASSMAVTVTAIPATPGTISGTPVQCAGLTGQIYSISSVPNATTYTWSVPGGWSITGGTGTTSITVTTGSAGQNGNISVTAGNGCGTSLPKTLAVTVNPGAPATPGAISGTGTQCPGLNGQIYSISAVPNASSYSWTAPTGWSVTGGAGTTSITVTTGSAGQNGNITVTASNGCGTSSASSRAVTVAPLPSAPSTELIQPTCALNTGTITVTSPTGLGMTYSIDGSNYTNSTGIFLLVTPGTYNVTAKSAAGCLSPGTIVTINAQPPTPVVPAQTASITSGGTFNITPSGVSIPVGTTYTWPAPTYTGFVTGGVAQLTPQLNISGTLTNPSGVGTAIYNVTPTSGPCTGTNFLVTVTVTSTCVPVAIVTQPTNTSMCATSGNASFTLVASGTGPFNYQWQYNNGGTWGAVVNGIPAGASYSNSTTPTLNVSGISTAGIPQYRCYITNCEGGNNTTSNIVNLTVNALPAATLTSSDADNIFCQGTTVIFTAGGGTNYNFRVNGVTLQNGTSPTYTNSTLANGQIVSVIVTNNITGCSAAPIQIQNIVNPEPFVLISSPTICSADFSTYSFGVTVTPLGVVTCSSPLATVTNTSGAIWAITGVPAGINVNITVTDSNGCTKTILVTAPDCNCPVVTAPVSGGDKSYCTLGLIPALTVTVQPGKTADWYNSSSGGTPVLQGSLSYTPSIAGTYYALAREISSGCVSSTRTAVTLTMNPLPVTSLTSSDADNVFCAGTSIIFTASGGTNYNFLVNGNSVQNGTSATFTTTSLTNGQVVRVMVTNVNGCSQISAPITNTVNPAPAPTLTSSDADNIFCAGTSVTFTAGGGTMYDFRIDGVTVQSGASPTYITNLLTNGQIVNVVVSNANGCGATSSNIVNSVNPVPVPELVSSDADNTFCAGTSVTFTAGGGTNFDFRVGGISVQSGTLSAYSTTSLTNGQVVDVIVANSTGCSVTSTGIFNTVNPQPATNAGTGGNVCDLKFKFNAVPSTGIGTWTKTIGPGTATFDPNPNTPNATVTVSEYGTYTFTWTEVSGPCSGSSTITVNFYQQPVAGAGTGGNNCGLEFHFNATLNVGTGTWAKVSGPGNATFGPDANTANALVTVTAYGTYNFSWIVVNGTCSDTANINVVFIEQLPADAGPGGSECDKDFILNANVTTNGTGTWTKASGPGNAVFTPDNHQPDAKVSVDQSGSYDFAWTVVNSTCNSTDIVSVVFHDLPVINAGRDTAVCKGSSVQLQAMGTGTFSWVPVELLSNPDIMNPVATPDITTTFVVSLIDQFGCKNKDSIIVEVREMLLADAGPDQELGYLFFTNMDAELAHIYETGVWTVISGTGEFTDSTSANTLVEGLSPGTNEFLWTVSNGFCPLSMDSVNIVVHGFVIPTLITPNMDGRNDNFVLKVITTLGKTELSIFDRRGARVYSNLNYDNSWNGVDYNENPLPDDTYFYVLKTENGKSLSGYIVIRR